jgi:hypothetical protein
MALLVATLFASDSFAGRDVGQMLAQEKANKAAIARRAVAPRKGPAMKPDVLPLDHGPRASTTPWLNQQRRLRAQADAGGAGLAPGG